MDRRWYGIIIILIIGIGCMYLVANSSTNIGSASVLVNDLSVTLPQNFKIVYNDVDSVNLQNRHNNETIYIKYIKDGNSSLKEYKNEMKTMKNNKNIEILDTKVNNTVQTIEYKNSTKEFSLTFFEKYDRTCFMKMENYNNNTSKNRDLMFILDTIQPDYKQNRS